MVLPLVPLVLIAVGSSTGAGGLVLGGNGARKMRRAQKSMRNDETRYRAEFELTGAAVQATNGRLKDYGRLQEAGLREVVLRMGDFLRRNARKVRDSQKLLIDGLDVSVDQITGRPGLDADTVAWIRGAIRSTATGAGLSAGMTGTVGTYGVASTGTAISQLSGIAAHNATMAALGGGSLASGGGGMALGATALNFVTIGPALLVGGLVVNGRGEKALTQARGYGAKVAIAMAELSQTRAKLSVIDARVDELEVILDRLVHLAGVVLDELDSQDFQPMRDAALFQRAMSLVMAVRDVASTGVVGGTGEVNTKTSTFHVKYRHMSHGGVPAGEDRR
jgi:hypothetical protein